MGAVGVTALSAPERAEAAPTDGEETFNVRDYGAVGDGVADDSPAFQKVLDTIIGRGRGRLYVPGGTYRFNSQVSKSTTAACALTIIGDGHGLSKLVSYNSDGVLKLRFEGQLQATVRDLSFIASMPAAGTAFEITRPEGGDAHYRQLVMTDVEAIGANSRTDYFNIGINAYAIIRPLFDNVTFAGPYGPGISGDLSDDSPLYRAKSGIQAKSCYGPSFFRCNVWSAYTGYDLADDVTGNAAEGGNFNECVGVQCRIGLNIGAPHWEPGLFIDRCHFNCRDTGIRATRRVGQISRCLFYNEDSQHLSPTGYSDILLVNSIDMLIQHNIFYFGVQPDRRMVDIRIVDNGLTGVYGASSSDIIITSNSFQTGGTAIAADPAVERIWCVDNKINDDEGSHLPITMYDGPAEALMVSSSFFRGVGLRRSSPQAIPDSTDTMVSWEQIEYDKGIGGPDGHGTDGWSSGAKVVIPKLKGIHQVRLTANIAWDANNAGQRRVEFVKNGSTSFFGNSTDQQMAVKLGAQQVQSAVIPVTDGDELGVMVQQTSGGPLNLDPAGTWFTVEVINS